MSKRAARAGVAAAAVGMAAGGYAIAWAASGPSVQAQPSGSDLAALAANNQAGTPGAPATPNPVPGGRWGGRHMFRAEGGTLTAVGPASITLSGPGGLTRTVNTDSSTTYSRDGAPAQRSVLAVGERVRVRLAAPGGSSPGASGSAAPNPTAANVNVIDPRVAGTVESIQGGVITVADLQGFWRTVATTGTTRFTDGTTPTTLSAIKVGDHLAAFGTIASDHTTLDAVEVRVLHPGAARGGPPAGGPGMMMPGGPEGPGGGAWFHMRGGGGSAT